MEYCFLLLREVEKINLVFDKHLHGARIGTSSCIMDRLVVLAVQNIDVTVLLDQSPEDIFVWVYASKMKWRNIAGLGCLFCDRSGVVLFCEVIKFQNV